MFGAARLSDIGSVTEKIPVLVTAPTRTRPPGFYVSDNSLGIAGRTLFRLFRRFSLDAEQDGLLRVQLEEKFRAQHGGELKKVVELVPTLTGLFLLYALHALLVRTHRVLSFGIDR